MISDPKWLGILKPGSTLVVLCYLAAIVTLYYTGLFSLLFSEHVVLGVIIMSVLTDGVLMGLHIFRKPKRHRNVSFDPSKLTIVIASKNGEEVLGETLKHALRHVPPQQVVVMDDKSEDSTAEVARGFGVQVIQNTVNLQKALSVSKAMSYVETPYVLVLDDDTLIGNITIPTSLLDRGYAAVAFNVLPYPNGSLINKLQMFEYRKSMTMNKLLRSRYGAVGNVSGAIGLFRTDDLKRMAAKHSGQYGGEDQQRTLFIHLESKAKGVVFSDQAVYTKAPSTLKKWFRQRTKSWNSSTQELFMLSWRVMLSNRVHYLLKFGRAYYLFILLTEPLRMLLVLVFIATFSVEKLAVIYLYYVLMSYLAWLKTGRKDPMWILWFFPFYSKMNMWARMGAHFYWFKKKYDYLMRYKWHIHVTDRDLVVEYSMVGVMLVTMVWPLAIVAFVNFGGLVYLNLIATAFRTLLHM